MKTLQKENKFSFFFLYFSFLLYYKKKDNKYFSFQYKYLYLKNLLFSERKKKHINECRYIEFIYIHIFGSIFDDEDILNHIFI